MFCVATVDVAAVDAVGVAVGDTVVGLLVIGVADGVAVDEFACATAGWEDGKIL
jgi:hypothetical protein